MVPSPSRIDTVIASGSEAIQTISADALWIASSRCSSQ
jgi:hypothetical protein